MKHFILPLLFSLSCTPAVVPSAPGSEVSASLELYRERYDGGGADQSYYVCGAVSVGQGRILTAAHCLQRPLLDTGDLESTFPDTGRYRLKDRRLSVYSDLYLLADRVRQEGDFAELYTKYPLPYVTVGEPQDGYAVVVERFRSYPVTLEGREIRGKDFVRGDSGSGIFQGGQLVGLVSRCTLDSAGNCQAYWYERVDL